MQAATDMLEDSMMTRARNIDTTCTTSMLTMLNEIDSSVASATVRRPAPSFLGGLNVAHLRVRRLHIHMGAVGSTVVV